MSDESKIRHIPDPAEAARAELHRRAYEYARNHSFDVPPVKAEAFAVFFTKTVMSPLGIGTVFREWIRENTIEELAETMDKPAEAKYLICPVPECRGWYEVSDADADATLSQMYQHIFARHASYNHELTQKLLAKVGTAQTEPEGRNLYLW